MDKKDSEKEHAILVATGIQDAFRGGMAVLGQLLYGVTSDGDASPKPQQAQANDGQPKPQASEPVGTVAKLSEGEKDKIVTLYDRGYGTSVRGLSIQFDVSRNVIDRALRQRGVKV